MARKRIFISHSTKADEPDAAAFLTAVEAGILARSDKFDLKVDRLNLEAGDDWRHKLYVWMNQADGAVVIIGRNALESNFVPIELSFLSIRAELDKTFPMIPVLLPGITRENVKAGVAGALDLKRLQFVRENTTDAAADNVVERLAELFEGVPTALGRWQNELIRKIGDELLRLHLDQSVLEDVGATVGWEDVKRSFRTPAHLRLAAHLVLAAPDEAERALSALQGKLAGPSLPLQNIYWNLLPQWIIGVITPDPADRLGQIVLGPQANRQLDFDLHKYEPESIKDAARFARWTVAGARRRHAEAPIRPLLIAPPGLEADLPERLRSALCTHLSIGKPRRLTDRLKLDDDQGRHLVLLLDPAEHPRNAQTVSLVRTVAEAATLMFLHWQRPPATVGTWPCLLADQTLDVLANIYESCATQLDLNFDAN